MKSRKFIVVALVLFSFGCQKAAMREQIAKPVKIKEVETVSAPKGHRYSATIRPNMQVEIGFKVGGYVEKISSATDSAGLSRTLQAGDVVSRGQVLAQLRRSEFQIKVEQARSQKSEVEKNVNTTRAQLNEIESSIAINKSQVSEAEINWRQAQTDFRRAQNLYNVQSLTKKDFDAAQTNLEMAEKRVQTARASLNAAQEKVKTVQAQVEQTEARIKTVDATIAETTIPLQDATLRAPLTAIVLERKIEAGELVAPNLPVFVLADTTSVKAVFGVPDIELQNLKLGQTLFLNTEALPDQQFSGHVSRIAPSADQNSRVFEVEVTIPNPRNLLKTGMIAALELTAEITGEERTVVPLSAVVRSKNKPESYAIFVAQEIDGVQLVRAREVTLGETYGNGVAIVRGLDRNEKIVVSGASFLEDGETVQIIP